MGLWGTTHDATTNKPKFLPDSEDSDYNRADCYATQSGWVMQPGHPSSGNGNTAATPEVLVAIGDLAGATATTGLKHPTMTNYAIITNAAHGTANNIVFEISYDEAVKYVAGSAGTLLLTATAGSNVTATVTHINGITLADNLIGNVVRFTATSAQATTYDLANDVTMGDPDLVDAVTSTAIETASKKFTSAVKTAIGYASIVIAAP